MTVFGLVLEASLICSRSLALSGQRCAMFSILVAMLPEEVPAISWQPMQLHLVRLSTMHPPCVTASLGGLSLSLHTLESGALPAASTAGAASNKPSPNSTV